MVIALWAAFIYAPTEATMGDLQRIFYIHVPAAIVGFIAAIVVAFASVMFLIKRDLKWDRLAVSNAELCVLFVSTAMLMGSIWAKPAWGVWWVWDARGTLEFALWLIFVAYLLLRHYVSNPTKRASVSAVFGILGAIDVPINYMSIEWYRTQHPSHVIGSGSDSKLDPDMRIALAICFVFVILLYTYLLTRRIELEKLKSE